MMLKDYNSKHGPFPQTVLNDYTPKHGLRCWTFLPDEGPQDPNVTLLTSTRGDTGLQSLQNQFLLKVRFLFEDTTGVIIAPSSTPVTSPVTPPPLPWEEKPTGSTSEPFLDSCLTSETVTVVSVPRRTT